MALRFIETDIEIDAAPETVWRVLADLPTWPRWHPYVDGARGALEEGSRVVLRKSAPGGRTMAVRQTVARVEDGIEFRLVGRLAVRGLLDNEHRFRVEPTGEGRTRFLHGQAFRGFLVRIMIRRRGATAYEVFDEINKALKAWVEGELGR
jgi:hypothetical protein